VGGVSDANTSDVDRTVAGLVTHLGSHGAQAEVWHLSPSNERVSEQRAGSVRVVELPAYRRARGACAGLPASTREFIRERCSQTDVLHLHSVFIPDNVSVAKLAGLPYVISPHGGYSPEVLHGRNRLAKAAWLRIRERDYVRNASLLHAVSRRELDQLRAMFDATSLAFIPNGIEVPMADASGPDTAQLSTKRIVFLGRLAVDHKGLDLLIEGYARLVRDRGPKCQLVIAGPDFRSGRGKLEALAASLLPDRGVQFVGAMFGDEKEILLRSAWVFVHTSRWEGMPVAVLEALGAGCPVLLTAATGLGEFVEEYGAGVVVEGNAPAIQEGLRTVLEAPPRRYQAMRAAALRLASERFTWAGVAQQMSVAYRSILQ